eukprot:CAMPEP_0174364574 /NCGR_PEP_ID=MMETSP0811_2-20130205/73511_1 /TAXON_ID=73025 ORGANISM="Eutreptiella gymnastica-like, Strain CCMP1594" /NCGR_SAMPLE_ID=MMETSP0811_2 /ASSEMBLY_ACC=CAM_ASM_000667 /LENGTH=63 /DNA_ID=CAMNT_0015504361 /DNA_START=154 /DNA_END=345 /DNA_ORIENTATION=+
MPHPILPDLPCILYWHCRHQLCAGDQLSHPRCTPEEHGASLLPRTIFRPVLIVLLACTPKANL